MLSRRSRSAHESEDHEAADEEAWPGKDLKDEEQEGQLKEEQFEEREPKLENIKDTKEEIKGEGGQESPGLKHEEPLDSRETMER